jgi:hypothetical protein
MNIYYKNVRSDYQDKLEVLPLVPTCLIQNVQGVSKITEENLYLFRAQRK